MQTQTLDEALERRLNSDAQGLEARRNLYQIQADQLEEDDDFKELRQNFESLANVLLPNLKNPKRYVVFRKQNNQHRTYLAFDKIEGKDVILRIVNQKNSNFARETRIKGLDKWPGASSENDNRFATFEGLMVTDFFGMQFSQDYQNDEEDASLKEAKKFGNGEKDTIHVLEYTSGITIDEILFPQPQSSIIELNSVENIDIMKNLASILAILDGICGFLFMDLNPNSIKIVKFENFFLLLFRF